MDKQKRMKIILGIFILILVIAVGINVYPQFFQTSPKGSQIQHVGQNPEVKKENTQVSNNIINPETLEKPNVPIGRADPFVPLISSENSSANLHGSSGSNINLPMIKINPFPPTLKLVGIMRVNDKMMAILENGQQTYTVKQGDIILGNIKVERIYLNSVVLTSSGQTRTYEL
ncbi:hypothetical protein Thena_0572 [Thermodesulfobium narugense DSM 14796]|uniref:Pilus assembly protein PilP n=1 Tax=Thermodesulfobium narugense DSM 14796 TaxID=747365 RepID=M1E6V9_9BACT|nr:hypothetical protein [Thermodesulfobium narugense]AEE14210.1 hypothetical protein Thena_0572 [Thermodesulfobium narugense DSM 14796]